MRKKKKAAIVYHYWAHYREPIVRLLCQQTAPDPEYVLFSGKKANNDIRTIEPSRSAQSLSEGGLRWRFIRNCWITKDIMWQSGLFKIAVSGEFDAIIYLGHMYFISTWISAFLARLSGKRVLMWTHGFLKEENNLKGWIRSRFYKLADCILLYGNRARRIMINKGFDPDTLYVVYNSLDYTTQRNLRERITEEECSGVRNKLFSEPELPVLVFVGRLTPQKKLNMLLRAASLLDTRNLKVNVLFVGDGSEREMLANLSKELGITQRVIFYGACHKEEELSKLLMMSDICIAPGEVGLTAMHSLAYGTPVITHDDYSNQMPEYEAIRDGISGTFYRHGDTEDLALTIERWLLNDKSKSEVRRQCFGIIEKYYNPEYQAGIINNAVLGKPAEAPPSG